MKIKLLISGLLFASASVAQVNPTVVTFEDNGGTGPLPPYGQAQLDPVDNTYFQTNYGVQFIHIDAAGNPIGQQLIIGQYGEPRAGFTTGPDSYEYAMTCGGNTGLGSMTNLDVIDPAFGTPAEFGCFFLADWNTVPGTTPDDMAILYDPALQCSQVSFDLLDIDPGEVWNIEVIDQANNMTVFSPGTAPSITFPFLGNGRPTNVDIDISPAFISEVRIRFAATGSGFGGFAMDNFVFCSLAAEEPGCCGGDNLVTNGNFEAGNTGFTSDYSFEASTAANAVGPTEYNIVSMADAASISPNWIAQDPSSCPPNTSANDNFMVVNGLTSQPAGTESVIWEQSFTGLQQGGTYHVCFLAKNLPQCTFDILPALEIQVGNSSSGYTTINTTSDPCDWQLIEFTFTTNPPNATIQIVLDESGLGDGNDLAIDNISLELLGEPDVSITVEHIGSTNTVTASINGPGNGDDALPGPGCTYTWFVAEVVNVSPLALNFSTLHIGDATGSTQFAPPVNFPTPWDLTTSFPDYTFNDATLYFVGLAIQDCDCFEDETTYQLTGSWRNEEVILTEAMEQQLLDIINRNAPIPAPNGNSSIRIPELNLYPNPAQTQIEISLSEVAMEQFKIVDAAGRVVLKSKSGLKRSSQKVNINSLNAGVYTVIVTDTEAQQHTIRFVKE